MCAHATSPTFFSLTCALEFLALMISLHLSEDLKEFLEESFPTFPRYCPFAKRIISFFKHETCLEWKIIEFLPDGSLDFIVSKFRNFSEANVEWKIDTRLNETFEAGRASKFNIK